MCLTRSGCTSNCEGVFIFDLLYIPPALIVIFSFLFLDSFVYFHTTPMRTLGAYLVFRI